MSWQATAWAQRVKTGNPARKLVLLALANYANDDGESIYPSIKTLCDTTELSDRTVQEHIRRLIDDGIIEVAQIIGSKRVFRMLVKMAPESFSTPENASTPTGKCFRSPPENASTLNLLIEPLEKPLDSCASDFLKAFRLKFPKRDGTYGWNDNIRKKLLKIKVQDRPMILRGVDAYRAEVEKNGKIGTDVVCMISTFVNQQRWEEYSDPALHPPKMPEPVEGIDYRIKEDGIGRYFWDINEDKSFSLKNWQNAWRIANGVEPKP